ncbi:TQO small subunit DoxD [Tengunoibacter tsumagoiensis]|uniref:Rieske domain-containing protein n=1 Tax=Tengunoibacter tsumagoiensis TaxID=2014871 RepID=A0A402A6J8_9CHLR|nr:TQO small subunit DoxD [Tengunoibacter tsumagoiensis]GCE14760.1 hypothetical protein KTT_46190 [Tengunoibacter tsumagoiensis]
MKPYTSQQTTTQTADAGGTSALNTSQRFPGWILLPLRLFLGVTFVYAGLQKLTDPHFFHPGSPDYIGNQLIAFAHGSPLKDLLLHYAVSHAVLLGLLVAFGEIAIGLGTLSGLLFRPAAFFGLCISFVFFLTASWSVYPYFYGADIVFVFAWLTLLLGGPLATGLFTLDGWLVKHFLSGSLKQAPGPLARICAAVLVGLPDMPLANRVEQPTIYKGRGQFQNALKRERESRRSFFVGTLIGGGLATLGVVAIGYTFNLLGRLNDSVTGSGNATGSGDVSTATVEGGTPTGGSGAIAQTSAVAKNAAITFTIPSTGDPGILIHLPNDQFVAFDATCTHAGCPVDYDAVSHHLICPCHGAEYDPANSANVLGGPTSRALDPVAISIDSATGAITLK